MNRVFVTGGGGLLGSRLLRALGRQDAQVAALDRSGTVQRALAGDCSDSVRVIPGDLLRPETYSEALVDIDTVVHLAAATGKASRDMHFQVNKEGTEILLDSAKLAGVRRFLFVSSIAAKFPDKRRYFYAQAKELAESAVRASGLEYAIVRPTIIIAPKAAVVESLALLAGLPVIPVLGKGTARVQPIWIDDLVNALAAMIEAELPGEIIELGGPEVLSIEELLQCIRQVRKGKRGGTVHLPLAPLLGFLGLVEPLGLGRFLPVNAGQLASFRFDGTVDTCGWHDEHGGPLKSVTEMLELSFAA